MFSKFVLVSLVGIFVCHVEANPDMMPTGAPRPAPTCATIQCPEGEHCQERVNPCLVPPCPTMPLCVRTRTTGLPGRSSCATMSCPSDEVCVLERECNKVGSCAKRPVCRPPGGKGFVYNIRK